MGKKRVTAAGVAVRVLIVIALAVAIYYVWQWRNAGSVAALRKVALGDDRDRVVRIMGAPDEETDTFPLPAHETLAGDAGKVDAETWLLYKGEMGTRCVVGFDTAGTVVYKGHTGS